jgi:rhodanese-related sulfurtransferase
MTTPVNPASHVAKPPIAPGKETVLGLYVTAKEAYEMWKDDPKKVKIIDVRTTEEFLYIGHPKMAWNIPSHLQSYQWDEGRRRFPMTPNPDFVSQVTSVVEPNDMLLVTCRSGVRGALAANLLAEAGFKNVYNIVDGIEGDPVGEPDSVFKGHRLKNGWKNSGLPWTYDIDIDRIVLPKVR